MNDVVVTIKYNCLDFIFEIHNCSRFVISEHKSHMTLAYLRARTMHSTTFQFMCGAILLRFMTVSMGTCLKF